MKRKEILKGSVVVVAFASLAASAAAGDETWINQGIKSAIAQGRPEYVLPAGTFVLSTPIVIPEGTKNFTLRGAGIDKTILKGDNVNLGWAIKAGISPVIHNNWGVANMTNVDLENVPDGAATIKMKTANTAVKTGQFIGIWDEGFIQTSGASKQQQLNHAELARVLTVSADRKTIFLDRPVGREYNINPHVGLINGRVIYNVTVRDMGFDGTVAGITADRNNGILDMGLASNCTVSNLGVKHFGTRAIQINWSRNITADSIDVRDGLNPQDAGSAYGLTFVKSRNSIVTNSYATDLRHGFVATNGSTDITFQDSLVEGDSSNFDTHGFDERRITWRRCKAMGINLGNTGWLGGGRGYRIYDCDFTYAVTLTPNTSDIKFENSNLGSLHIYAKYNTVGIPASGRPADATFNYCSFAVDKTGLFTGEDFGSVTLNNCYLEMPDSPWGKVIVLKEATGTVTLKRCGILNSSQTAYVPLVISTPSPTFKLNMDGCSIGSSASAAAGILLDKTFAGSATITNGIFYSNTKGAALIQNLSTKTVPNINNRATALIAGIQALLSLFGASPAKVP